MKTAETWFSYRDCLIEVLNHFLPSRCFEWGVGKSTELIASHQGVDSLDSVEHNLEWIDKAQLNANEKVQLIHEPNELLYPLVQGRFDEYDLIFIDGILREECLIRAKDKIKRDGLVILHDAERENYKDAIDEYRFKHWQDKGSTVVLTDNFNTNEKLRELF